MEHSCEHPHHANCDCGHHHEHEHEHEHEGSGRRLYVLIGAAALLLVAVFIEHQFCLPTWQLLLVYLVPYLIVGHDTLREAWEGIREGEPFNEHLLMSVATIGALCIGFLPGADTEFPEAVRAVIQMGSALMTLPSA